MCGHKSKTLHGRTEVTPNGAVFSYRRCRQTCCCWIATLLAVKTAEGWQQDCTSGVRYPTEAVTRWLWAGPGLCLTPATWVLPGERGAEAAVTRPHFFTLRRLVTEASPQKVNPVLSRNHDSFGNLRRKTSSCSGRRAHG